MKMRFSKKGRQFFFFTFCIEGRKPLLSRLVSGAAKGRGKLSPAPPVGTGVECAAQPGGAATGGAGGAVRAGGAGGAAPRPLDGGGNSTAHAELLPLGEAVLKWLLSLHAENAALTLSNRVIMPDHVHFLLIVDFDRDPAFDPLVFAHRFRQEAAHPRDVGHCPPRPPVAPVQGARPNQEALRQGPRGVQPPVLWEHSFWISLSFSARQLAAIRRYICGNPARALWKKAHSDRFRAIAGIRHGSLDPALRWSAMGDPTLLASPFRFPVRLTRRLPVEAQEEALDEAINRARRGMVPVCGFISPAEHELERRLRAEPAARWIKTVPFGLKPGYDPSMEDSRALAAGQLLLLSSFPADTPVTPISRANCEAMNGRLAALCGEAAEAINTSVGASPLWGARAPPPSLGQRPHLLDGANLIQLVHS